MRRIHNPGTLGVTTLFLAGVGAIAMACSSEEAANNTLPVGSTGGMATTSVIGAGGATAAASSAVVGLGGATIAATASTTAGGATTIVTTAASTGGATTVTTTVGSTGGTTATGTTATGGATSAGGTTSDPCAAKTCSLTTCTTVTPAQALLTDFTSEKGEFNSGSAEWWNEFFGGTYVYPATNACLATQPTYPLTQTFTGGQWTISGTAGTYSGFGLYFSPCSADMSAYTGVSFTISGTAGLALTFAVATVENSAPDASTCPPTLATCTATSCASNNKVITLTAEPTTVTVPWTDLTGGAPATSVTASQITGMSFTLPWTWTETPAASAYAVNVVVDNIQLVQ